jgi:hypothetical protein
MPVLMGAILLKVLGAYILGAGPACYQQVNEESTAYDVSVRYILLTLISTMSIKVFPLVRCPNRLII